MEKKSWKVVRRTPVPASDVVGMSDVLVDIDNAPSVLPYYLM